MTFSNQSDNLYEKIISALTMQEYRILEFSKKGACNKETASHFNISVETVRKHRRNIMRKLGIEGKTGMAKFLISISI